MILVYQRHYDRILKRKLNQHDILFTQRVSKTDTGTIASTSVECVYMTSVTMSTEPASLDVKMDIRETYA